MDSTTTKLDVIRWGVRLRSRKTNFGWALVPEANVMANIDGKTKHSVAESKNSLLDALKDAFCKMLCLGGMEISRKVKMVSNEEEIFFEVYITFSMNGNSWHVKKFSQDIEEASYFALIEGFQEMFC